MSEILYYNALLILLAILCTGFTAYGHSERGNNVHILNTSEGQGYYVPACMLSHSM